MKNDTHTSMLLLLRVRRAVAAQLARELGANPPFRILRKARPATTSTNGWSVTIGTLSNGLSAELWLDHYSGHSTPRLWYGLHSRRPVSDRLARLDAHAGFTSKPLVITTRRIVKAPGRVRFYRLGRPLAADQFDRLVDERYRSADGYYFGVYDPRWPLTGAGTDVARAAAQFFARMASPAPGNPAARAAAARAADRESERAAIKHVRQLLRQAGYRVWSREAECLGYDLLARGADGELHVEVKGTSLTAPSFYITAGEWDARARDPLWRLVVAVDVKRRPTAYWLKGEEAQAFFSRKPKVWFCSARRPIPARLRKLR